MTVSPYKVSGGAFTGCSDFPALPSAQVYGARDVYVVWEDCTLRPKCAENDLVMLTSSNGTAWSTKARIPVAAVTSKEDAFVPGIGVYRATSRTGAHLALYYYYYANCHCAATKCQEFEGFIGSTHCGASWRTPTRASRARSESACL